MKILVITPVLPWPPNDGDRIRIYNILKQLKPGNKIYLASFVRGDEQEGVKELSKLCEKVVTTRIGRPGILFNTAVGLILGMPMNATAYMSIGMKMAVRKLYRQVKPDCIFCYRLRSAQFARGLDAPKAIDIVDSMSLYLKRQSGTGKDIFRRAYSFIDAPRVFGAERGLGNEFDAVFVNFEEDAEFVGIKDAVVAPNGAPEAGPLKKKKPGRPLTVGFMGPMSYAPNADAAVWFVKNVWKKEFESDKNIRLVIAGSGGDRLGLQGGNIEARGFVSRPEDEVRSWDLCVDPVRYGAGRQNKIMMSWACGVPVVSTTFAAAGVYGKHGKNMLIADSEKDFAAQIKKALKDKKLAGRLVKGGLSTVRQHFSWKKTGAVIAGTLKKITRS